MNVLWMVRDGGFISYIVVAMGFFGIGLGVLSALVLGVMRVRIPATLGWVGLTSAVIAGAIGTAYGLHQMNQALAVVSSDLYDVMMAAGTSVSLITLSIAFLIAGLGFLLTSLATALPAAIRPGPEPRMDIRSMASAVGGAVLTAIVAVAIGLFYGGVTGILDNLFLIAILATATAVGTLAVVIASSRVDREDHVQQGRIAGSRGATLMAATLGVGLLTEGLRLMVIMQVLEASVAAPSDDAPALIASSMQMISVATTFGWLLALVPLVAGIAGLTAIVGRADGRVGAGVVIGGLQIVLILGAILYASSAISTATTALGM